MNPIVFGNNRPNRITDMGENVLFQNQFFEFKSDGMGFFEKKKLKNCIAVSSENTAFFEKIV